MTEKIARESGKIIVGRHADARLTYRLGRPGKTLATRHDRHRQLTRNGIAQAYSFGATLRKHGIRARTVVTSGLARADHTAVLATDRTVVDLHLSQLYDCYFAGDAMKVLHDTSLNLSKMFQADETHLMRLEILATVDPIVELAGKGDVYVVCHGIVAEFLAYMLTGNKRVLKRTLGTCEALMIEGGEISWLAP